jgi:uncharacterized membrane protein YphA (DoxX/SURF4 family)
VLLIAVITVAHAAGWMARIALAAVFLAAAVAKGRDLDGTREGVSALASPSLAPIGVALPLVEALLGVGLLIPTTARLAAIVSIILLLIFSALIIRGLRQDHPPACHCFGGNSKQPVSTQMVMRNAAFIVLAVVAFGI